MLAAGIPRWQQIFCYYFWGLLLASPVMCERWGFTVQ
jgi:hypothetical protein